jgi:hypothetical protein
LAADPLAASPHGLEVTQSRSRQAPTFSRMAFANDHLGDLRHTYATGFSPFNGW